MKITRRRALGSVGSIVVDTVAGAQRPRAETGPRLAPREQLVNVLEYGDQAKRVLPADAYAKIAGGDRSAFDRITLRPRMMIPVLDLDLGVTLFGGALFAPILVAPVAQQARFHPDGERATIKGASAARAVTVVSSHSSVPIAELMTERDTPTWYQVFANDAAAGAQARDAVKAGCAAICVAIGAPAAARGVPAGAAAGKADWAALDVVRRAVDVPILARGITTPDAAKLALTHQVQGIIVSSYGGPEKETLILDLPAIVDAVGGKVPVLVDGGVRRGTDVLKALAFGARAVLVGRPVMWGLAAYGAEGVQGVVEMLQTELARYMAMCGKSNLTMLDRSVVRVHRETGHDVTR